MRHTCEEGDKLRKYGWIRHDGHHFGEQDILDPKNDLHLQTTFLKQVKGSHGITQSFIFHIVLSSFGLISLLSLTDIYMPLAFV